jgi:cation diffusion facilitator family transporter
MVEMSDENTMQPRNRHPWQHSHTFGQEQRRPGEKRTIIVILLTASVMTVEIAAGLAFGSMALLADGLHMASHAVALSVNAFAYVYARRHSGDRRYSFGTGKINTLGGFCGAVLLAVFALLMVGESTRRFVQPVPIIFNQAILVAVLGLLVNGLSVFILGARGPRDIDDSTGGHDHDHNLRSAYLHVMADALTSFLAIMALLAAKHLSLVWMDPAMGIVGAVLVARWSYGLLRTTSHVLLDRQGPEAISREIRECIEADRDSKVADLHLWSIGPGIYALEITVIAQDPATPDEYRARIPGDLGVAHISLEIHRCSTDTGDTPCKRL